MTLLSCITAIRWCQQVDFLLDGNQLKLKQVAAASGTRYSDGNYTFWSKGPQAFVQRGDDIILNDCVQK